ncbi:flagellar assembly protein FliW [Cohnella sp. CFH 77786]|uniref:flagellar assembly protein FliW n=1 Tax=Cohnella sp. CFH 77786 TaxID=2662265 RepID=UPI001C6110A6|nr:flagellar assembly protein FliW [Cohnella sp. CFH 77786]MBW5448475.1 flagellar assembly protein FliW [Cohnella sp. CFH 77786]
MFVSLYGKTIAMRGTILGFSELESFVLIPVDESNPDSPFAYLQSEEDSQIGFLVADPFRFDASYQFELSEQDKEELEAADPGQLVVLAIVTIADPFDRSTMNLLAPLLINTHKLIGKQIVLPPETSYSTKTRFLVASLSGEGEEASC